MRIPENENVTITLTDPLSAPWVAASVPVPFVYAYHDDADRKHATEFFESLEFKHGADVHIVSHAALQSPVPVMPAPQIFSRGQVLSIKVLIQTLADFGYIRLERPENQGEYSVRGDTIDICGPKDITRISFFGDEIEAIKTVDVGSFATIDVKKSFTLNPIPERANAKSFTTLLESLKPSYPIIVINEGAELHIWHHKLGAFAPAETVAAYLFSEPGEFVLPEEGALVYHEKFGLGKFVGEKNWIWAS